MHGKMRRIVMDGPRTSHVETVDIPQISGKECLVQVTYSGICHSEFQVWADAKPGTTMGHESVGVVCEIGPDVTGFSVGDRVTGLGGGAYSDYIVMEEHKMVHVPDPIADEDAIVEPLACLLSAAMKLPIETLGDPMIVVGCGYMGLGMISLFRCLGYGDIIAIDKRPEALKNARKFGATTCYTPDEIPPILLSNFKNLYERKAVILTRDGTNAELFDMGCPNVMEFTGTEDGLQLAGDLVRAHGRLGIGGYHNDGPRTIDYMLWNFKAITTINCHERRIDYETKLCQRCIDLLESGQWKFRGLTTHYYEMDEFDQANEDLEHHNNGYIKGVVKGIIE